MEDEARQALEDYFLENFSEHDRENAEFYVDVEHKDYYQWHTIIAGQEMYLTYHYDTEEVTQENL